MKKLRIAGLVILMVVVLALITLRAVGVDPSRTRPGLWLAGDLVTTPVTDWSFTDALQNIVVETRTWYFIPHSVHTYIARNNGQLYLFSDYLAPKPGQPDLRDRFPEARFWNRNVVRDPRIRLKIGNRLFEERAYPLTEPSEIAVARQAFLGKYADLRAQQTWEESRRPKMHFFRLEPR